MAFRLSASGAPASEATSRSSGSMFGKMKDRAAAATAYGMAAASTAATKAKKTAKYGVSVARDAAGLSSSGGSAGRPAGSGPPAPRPGGGYMPHEEEDDDEEMELQRALAASMKTANQEEHSRGTEAPPARPMPRVAPQALPGLDMLVEMGFDESLAKIALQACDGDVEAALAQLCADRDDMEGASDGSTPVGTPTHAGGTGAQRQAVLEAAEKRRAEARSNAGTMDDWRQEQRNRQAAARSEATSRGASKPAPEEPVTAPVTAAEALTPKGAAEREEAPAVAETEELMLQQALAASMGAQEAPASGDPHMADLQLRQAMPDDELDLQMALSASLHTEKQDASCAGAAVGEEAEQEEERARLSAAAQQHLATEDQRKEGQESAPPA